MNMVQIMAHRAGSKAKPNTVEAVKEVLALKPDIIELDVRLSKDKVPVCYHGNILETLGFYSSTNFHNASVLQQRGISTLPQLANIIQGKVDVFLDIKDYRITRNHIFDSFNEVMPSTLHIGARNLDYFKRFGEKPENVLFCRNFGFRFMPQLTDCKRRHVDVVEVAPGLANKKTVSRIHEAGFDFAISPFMQMRPLISSAVSLGARWVNVYDVQFYRNFFLKTQPI